MSDEFNRRKDRIVAAGKTALFTEFNSGGDYALQTRRPHMDPRSPSDINELSAGAASDATLGADFGAIMTKFGGTIPAGGTLVDTGQNAGRFAEYAALSRRDINVVCIEEDPALYAKAQENLQNLAKTDPEAAARITLLPGPLAERLDELAANGHKADTITSIYQTHLKTDAQNQRDLAAMGNLAKASGASIVTMDLNRPYSEQTIQTIGDAYPGENASASFHEGYKAGLRGAYRVDEMEQVLAKDCPGQWQTFAPMPMGPAQYQAHFLPGNHIPPQGATPPLTLPATNEEFTWVREQMLGGFDRGASVANIAHAVGNVFNRLGSTYMANSPEIVYTGEDQTIVTQQAAPPPVQPEIDTSPLAVTIATLDDDTPADARPRQPARAPASPTAP